MRIASRDLGSCHALPRSQLHSWTKRSGWLQPRAALVSKRKALTLPTRSSRHSLRILEEKKRSCELVIFLIFISNISAGLEEGYLPLCRLSCGSAATSISVSGTETRVSQHEASVPRPAMASLFVFFRKTKKSNKTFDLRRNEEVAMRHVILPSGEA